jgi:4-diphosphocytidyl-2-C-methyl-D-erythritol kinase
MYVRRRSTLVEVATPAKVNLFLEVLTRRKDGFHEIQTLMAPIRLFDTVLFATNPDGRIHLTCRWACGVEAQLAGGRSASGDLWPTLPQGADNLVHVALERLRERAGTDAGASVVLVKRIPAAAGLGGASSDAAAVLVAANAAWRLGWDRRQLSEVAAEVGSDVPFFLHGTPCLCHGRGEKVEPLGGTKPMSLVVVRPPQGLSTPEVYRQSRPAERPESVESLLAAWRQGHVAQVGRRLFNRLQEAAARLSPWIARLQAVFDPLDCLGHQMSGSGTSYFGICRHARHARRVAGCLRAAGFGAVFPATTMTAAFRPS